MLKLQYIYTVLVFTVCIGITCCHNMGYHHMYQYHPKIVSKDAN